VSAPRALLLDFAGVLADFDRDGRTARLASAAGLTPDEVDAHLYDSGLVPAADGGEVTAEEFRTELRERLGLPDDETAERLWASAFTPDPAALAVLVELDPGLPRGVLSNNDALLAQVLPRLLPEVFAGMDPIAFAGALGAAKPDAEAYLRAVAPWGVDPADVLFVDDSVANVDGARAAGLQAEQAAGAEELAAVLAGAGLLRQ
jgi:HAD superfamily hydrolase (TIGR01509 family)